MPIIPFQRYFFPGCKGAKMANDPTQTSQGKRKSVSSKSKREFEQSWQKRLLPVMIGLLLGLSIFFFTASFIQMTYLHSSMLNYPLLDLSSPTEWEIAARGQTFDEQMRSRDLEILASMEAYVVGRRYHQASVLLMAGLWVRYLGFVTGMILALVGASFVLGKLSEPESDLSGKTSLLDFSVKSTSPGIILVFFGVVLMFATILNQDTLQVDDVPVYLSRGGEMPGIDLEPPPLYPTLAIPDELLLPTTMPASGEP